MTKVVERPFIFAASLGGGEIDAKDMRVTGLRIFKPGTFTDMFGRETTWVSEDMQRIAANFADLKGREIFPNVPMRVDHSSSVRNIVAYFDNVQYDAVDGFLKGDITFVDPAEFAHYQNGKYRNRSIEVGTYVTNQGTELAPVMYGCAFVDIPAVEGLFRKELNMSQQQGDPTPTSTEQGDNGAPSVSPEPTADPQGNPATTGDAPTDDQQRAAGTAQGGNAGQSTEPPATMGTSQSAGGQMHKFMIAGREVTDPNEVQACLSRQEAELIVLRGVVSASQKAAKDSWVEQLVKDNKIMAPQKDAFRAHIETLDEQAYASFRVIYDSAPPSNLFARHDTDGGATGTGAPTNNEKAILEAQVERMPAMGMTREQIEKSDQFKRLQALTTAA
jgi:hypothetical protein